MKKILTVLVAILFLITIVSSTFFSNVFDKSVYHKLYEKNGVYEEFDSDVLDEETENLISQIKGESVLEPGFFNEKEISHLFDVRNLLKKVQFYYYIIIILFIAVFADFVSITNKDFIKYGSYSLIISFALFLLITISFFIFDFSLLFQRFHELFFPQGNYLFSPKSSNMIRMFPQGFFEGFLSRIFIISFAKLSFSALFGFVLLKMKVRFR